MATARPRGQRPGPDVAAQAGGAVPSAARKTRIQAHNERKILDAADIVFAKYGFDGATIDAIADRARISKPNLHYYFRTKRLLYLAVLGRVLSRWLAPLATLDPRGDPASELARYIGAKLELTRRYPNASRVFANEILHGAPELGQYLRTDLKRTVDLKTAVIAHWTRTGQLADIEPLHLLFLIWAATQHYADFAPQVKALMNVKRLGAPEFDAVQRSLVAIVLNGMLPRGSGADRVGSVSPTGELQPDLPADG